MINNKIDNRLADILKDIIRTQSSQHDPIYAHNMTFEPLFHEARMLLSIREGRQPKYENFRHPESYNGKKKQWIGGTWERMKLNVTYHKVYNIEI